MAFTPETIQKMRLAKLGKKRAPHSEQTKIKMSLASKGRPKSLEHREALSSKKLSLFAEGKIKSGFTIAKEKNPEWQTGSNNWKWISNRDLLSKSDTFRNSAAHREWSKQVKNRDGWKCKISNGDCSGRVEAHHILSWREYEELRYQINNGITLCHAHHPRKRAEEKRLQSEFQALVSVSNN